MNIAVITAMPVEMKAVCAALEMPVKGRCAGYRAIRGRCASHDILIVESGMGFDNAARTVTGIMDAAPVDLILSTGFCGGISAGLHVGDVVVALEQVIADGSLVENVPVKVPDFCHNFLCHSTETQRRFGGLFVSTPRMVPKKQLTALFPCQTRPMVVEMESAAIAIVAVENGIPFAALRSVSDPLEEELDFSLEEFCNASMGISIPNVLATCLRKPHIIPQLIRLNGNCRVAAATLTLAVKDLLKHI